MSVMWTKEQQQVIDVRDRNILVSAAAGSGKTAVLVERIITRLLKDSPPVDIDELLVVTFTEAAAAEMKERIRQAIEVQLEKQPENLHLQRQSTLVHNASITTIHSFCLSVIREHFHTIDLDPGFRIAEEGELHLLKQDVVKEVLETHFLEGEKSFFDFVECFATGKDDKKLEELILKIYTFSESYEDPESWLKKCVQNYEHMDMESYEKSKPIRLAMDRCESLLSDARKLIEAGLSVCMESDGPYMYESALLEDKFVVEKILREEALTARYETVCSVSWKRLASNKDGNVSEAKAEFVKAVRTEVKDIVGEIKKLYFFQSPEEMLYDAISCKPVVSVLTELVQEFADAYDKKKRERNMIDFGDMERFALKILTRKEEGVLVPSETAKEYQTKYKEIMIDEYQDSNFIQEAILTSVSTVSQDKNNIFMVGDVKQSIYRFRLSRPELFMEKYHSYTTSESEKQRIDLHKNFRSRREVLDTANFLFEQIMTESLGKITYDENAALYVGADYEPKEGNETELLLIQSEEILSLGITEVENAREAEAEAIAGKIKEMVGTHPVFDKQTGTYRPAQYKDIVILARSMKGWAEPFTKILGKEGIPVYTGTGEGYFTTIEISVMLHYLSVIDNRKQDIPLAAAMVSPIGGFSADEMAKIKAEQKERAFHEAVVSYVDGGTDGTLKVKIGTFLKQIEYFRSLVPYTAIHHLLLRILDETGYGAYAAAMPGGNQRKANLYMLIEKAKAFGTTSYKGLFNFVRYMEQLKKYDIDYGEANILDEQSDLVRMMTIHKSKGLEFPIVIVAGMSKRFNMQDGRGSVVIHPEFGIGIDAADMEQRTKIPTMLKKIIQKELQYESLAEELRVLYVALTRAKEKLIITGTVENLENILKGFEAVRVQKECSLSFRTLVHAASYLQWIIPGFLRHQGFAPILECYGIPAPFGHPYYKRDIPLKVTVVSGEALIRDEMQSEMQEMLTEDYLDSIFKQRAASDTKNIWVAPQFSFVYPYEEEQGMNMKFTVSDLKKRIYMEEEDGKVLYEAQEETPIIPKFMQEQTKLRGASRGSAYHKLLELLDFRKEYEEDSLRIFLQELVRTKKMEPQMAECIQVADMLCFLESSIGKRMRQAAHQGKLKAEQPFVLGVDAKKVYPDTETSETLLVQGIIDVYFEEEDGLVVLDYKTDRVKHSQILVDKYKTQLQYYGEALRQLTGKHVKEMWIYAFALEEEIKIDHDDI